MTSPDITRRHFLERTGLAVGAGLLADARLTAGDDPSNGGKPVAVVHDPTDAVAASAPAQWAVGQLRDALAARGVSVRLRRQLSEVAPEETCILAGGGTAPLPRDVLGRSGTALPDHPEALALVAGQANGRPVVLACGSDARGLAYALLELADRVAHAEQPLAGLDVRRPVVEQPANPVRSVTRLFTSDVEDRAWFHDRAFWPPYLEMLAGQRFNRFSLTLGLGYDFTRGIRDAYLHFAYPFLLAVPEYQVRAVPLPDAERDRNLDMLHFIGAEATKRGLHFQLGLWTHAYQWTDSPQVNYTVEGLTPETHAGYCRDALRALLKACPTIAGVTFRIHGESGVAEGSYDFWKTVFDGAAKCGRKVEIDMHAKGIDQPMIDLALATGLPVNVSPKFWAEHLGLPYHQAAVRELEMPPRDQKDQGFFARSSGSRRFLRYGYGDLLAEGRRYGVLYRIWPGTQRLLLWGDPAAAAGYGRTAHLCGSLGLELCEPLSFKGRKGSGRPGGRTAYEDAAFRPAADWQKYRYGYRLWGRLLYNPDADPDVWRRFLRRQFGAGAEAAEQALAHASRVLPLVTTAHLPSAANNNFWPEVYTNMSIVDATAPHPYGDSPSPKRFGTVSPLDPALFARIDDWAEDVLRGRPDPKYAPGEVAQWLHDLADAALKQLAKAEGRVSPEAGPEWRRLAVDVALQSGLGHFFAWKLRAGALWALAERGGDRAARDEALKAYRAARAAWADLARRADGVYVRDITFGLDRHLRGHWQDRLAAIDQDVERMAKLVEKPAERPDLSDAERDRLRSAVRQVLAPPRRPSSPCRHTPPEPFRPGQPLAVALTVGLVEGQARPASVRLHYRHVNQGETYRTEEMRAREDRWEAPVPGAYTESPYALQYFFELRDGSGRVWLLPGFEADLCNQPYFVVRQG